MENKRLRTPNYTSEEMSLLLNLVAKYKHIIENKTTDHVHWAQKKQTWSKIESLLNAHSNSTSYRSADSLKKHYENKKSSVKKEVANEKMLMLKTGGGQYIPKTDPLKELTLQVMNPVTVSGLQNRFDSDSQLHDKESEIISIICEGDETQEQLAEVENDCEEQKQPELPNEINGKEKLSKENYFESDSPDHWKNYTSESLKRPMDKALSNKIKNVKKPSINEQNSKAPNKSWLNRRRPVAGVLHGLQSSHLANRYSELAELKLEMTNIQLEIVREEKVSKVKENELKQNILEVELEIKKKQLQLLNRSSF